MNRSISKPLALLLVVTLIVITAACAFLYTTNAGQTHTHGAPVWGGHVDHLHSLTSAILPVFIILTLITGLGIFILNIHIVRRYVTNFFVFLESRGFYRKSELQLISLHLRSPPSY